MARTYISLFSSAGVGCYGFKMNDFRCIATNELLNARLDIQRANNKCQYESGYICGDATDEETHNRILAEIERWQNEQNLQQVDVVFATPPCQGMSTANYKKTDHEQVRNSLVVEAIRMIKMIRPKIFVFENVRAFMKSICTDISGQDMLIKDSIFENLSEYYNIYWKVINFKDYGVPSSRPRTLVIGTSRNLGQVSPLHLFPTRCDEIPLTESIGAFPRLNYCEKDANDPLHFARPFPEYMLDWIKDLKEGETAFDNPDETKPCTFDANGNRIVNKGAYMGNKYRRLIWNRPGACIATRSDVMSSQDTIHPCDNRVLSIRELMTLMTIPDTFRWTDHDDQLTVENSDTYLKENEGNIRRCIGEAVPTHIGYSIARKIKTMLDYEDYMNGIEEDIDVQNNFYIRNNDLRDNYFDVSNAFDDIMKLNNDVTEISIGIESLSLFVENIAILSSYYSHIENINIDVYIENDEEKNRFEEILSEMTLGSNVHIKGIANLLVSFYDVRVGVGRYTEYKRPKVRRKSYASKRNDYVELSLF